MSTQEWGHFDDPDTFTGIGRYGELGYEFSPPDTVRTQDPEQLHALAVECGTLLQDVYKGKYPLSAKDAEVLQEGVRSGATNLFTLTRGGELAGMAALVDQQNYMGGDVSFTELGRAVARPATDGQGSVPMRAMLKYRLPWSYDNLPHRDYLYSLTRSAGQGGAGTPSGKGVQSVWWGAGRHGSQIPMITTGGSWSYKLNGIEPFTGFVAPVDPARWVEAVNGQGPIYVPDQADKAAIGTLLKEGTRGKARPRIVAVEKTPETDTAFHEVYGPSDLMAAKYVVSEHGSPLQQRSETDVDNALMDGISQRVVIEADVAGTPRGAAVMQRLHEQGWSLIGWWPSEVEYGAVCPEMARVNPLLTDELVTPTHHPEYFDHNLPETRRFLDQVYTEVLGKASLAGARLFETMEGAIV